VDSCLVQSGHSIYHHSFFLTEKGNWAVIQQGMNRETRMARRYHWLNSEKFVLDPKRAGVGDPMEKVLDLSSKDSEECQKAILDFSENDILKMRCLSMPRKREWENLKRAYQAELKSFEDFTLFPGIGPATLRGLASVSELVYGTSPSWKDPVSFSFAFGGKDGIPYPVNKESMDGAISFLRDGIKASKAGRADKLRAFENLGSFLVGLQNKKDNPG
jgi:hypothetical protein